MRVYWQAMSGVLCMKSALRPLLRSAVGALVALVLMVAYGNAYADRAFARYLLEEGARLEKSGNADAALDQYEKAIAADPDYLPAYEAAAPHWLRKGATSEIIRQFERITLRKPEYAFGWYTLAYAYRLSGRLDHAVMAYESCIQLRPREAEPYFGLAMVHKRAGRSAEAIAAFRMYITLERDSAKAEYVAQAKQEITALGGALPEGESGQPVPVPSTPAPTPSRADSVRASPTAQTPPAWSKPTPEQDLPKAAEQAVPRAAEQAAPSAAKQAAPQAARQAALAPSPASREDASRPGLQADIAQVAALIDRHRYASADVLLGRIQARSPAESVEITLLRAKIALGRGDHDKARELLHAARAQAPNDRRIDAILRTLPQVQK